MPPYEEGIRWCPKSMPNKQASKFDVCTRILGNAAPKPVWGGSLGRPRPFSWKKLPWPQPGGWGPLQLSSKLAHTNIFIGLIPVFSCEGSGNV